MFESIADAVVNTPFGDSATVEDVVAFWVNGSATHTSREVKLRVDVQEEFLLEGDGEDIIWATVGLDTSRHADQWVRGCSDK